MKRLALAVLLALSPLAGGALAQSFPERPITLVNPYAAGGPADLLARTVAEGMSEALGRPVIVDNRPGAGTAIGARAVAQAKPDGYTLFIGGSPSHVITPALMKDAGYDGIASFAPIATVGDVPNVLIVPPSRPYKSVPELVAAARSAGGNLTFATVGVGSIPQFLGILLQLRADVKLIEVPYKGGAPAAVDLLGGRVDLAFLNVPAVLSQVQGGTLRALAVASATRAKADHGRGRLSRFRDEHLVRNLGTGRNLARDHRQALCRHRPDAEHAESEGQDRIAGRPSLAEGSRGVRGLPASRCQAHAGADQARQHDGELIGAARSARRGSTRRAAIYPPARTK